MGVLPILLLSVLCLLNTASTEDKANCLYNGNKISHGETVTDGCKICECDNGEIKDCVAKAGCFSKNLNTHDGVSTNFEDDPNVIESSAGMQLKRQKRSNMQGNLNLLPGAKSGNKGGANMDGKVAVTSGIAGIKNLGIGGSADVSSVLRSQIGNVQLGGIKSGVQVGSAFNGGQDNKVNGNAQLSGIYSGVQVGAAMNGGQDNKVNGNAQLSGIYSGVQVGAAVNGGQDNKGNNKGGANAEGTDVKSLGIGGSTDLSSMFGSGKSQLGGINSGVQVGAALNGRQDNKVNGNAQLSGIYSGVQVGAAVNGGQDNKGQLNLGFGRGNQEKQGKVGINSQGRIKDSSEEDEGHLHSGDKSGNGQGSNEEQGKINIRIKGGMKGSFKEDHSKENKGHPQSGGKSGNGQGSDEEQGKINIRIKGEQKGSIEEGNSKENKGHPQSGGKSGNGQGSDEEQGKINIRIKGGQKGSIEEGHPQSGGKSGNGQGSDEEQGKINIRIKGGKKGSFEEDNSQETKGHSQSEGKSGNGQGSDEEQGKINIRIKGIKKGSFKEDNSKENKGHPQSGGKSGNGQGSDEEQGKINIRIKGGKKGSFEEDNSQETKGHSQSGGKSGNGQGSDEEQGKINIRIKGGKKGSFKEDNSKENKGHPQSGGKSGNGQGSDEEQGKINIRIKGGKKGSFEEDNSQETKGHSQSGGKSGNGQGSDEEQGKINIPIKGGKKGSFKEDNSKENKGHPQSGGKSGNGQGSDEEQGKINIRIKGGKKGSFEEDNSQETKVGNGSDSHEDSGKHEGKHKGRHDSPGKKHIGKSSLEDIDLDSGTFPTNSPEVTIEPIIIPQTAHILYEENSKGTEEVETKKPTEPVVPVGPVNPTEPVIPEEPVEPTEPVLPVPVVPEEPVEPTEPVLPEPVVPEEPVEPTEPVLPEPVVPEKPVKPSEPVLPEPVVPEEPVEPTEPVVPEEPVEPTEPVLPEPVVPEEPVKPSEPVLPEPVVPEEPVEPTEPVVPEEPVEPTEPVPVIPEEPVNPTEVIEPAPATSPAPPKHSGESCTFNKDIVADGQTVELDCVTCTCNDGALTCVKNMSCPGVCSVTAYQMIRTFDGTLYETPGTCSYVLVKTQDFTINLNNKLCSEVNSDVKDPEAVCIDSVDVNFKQKANIRLQSDGSILVAGEKSDLPYSLLDTITVLRSSSVFLDVVSQTFNLQYDFASNRLYVILDASYKDTTSGLCGTYNDNRNDDYRSSSDITETVSGLFSKSWKTQPQCSESQKSPENTDNKVEADLTCADSLDSSIFEDCALLIDTHSYKTSCSHSVYYAGSSGLCSALADYAYRCARAGITVSVSSTFSDCTPVCEGDMTFTTDDTFSQQDCAEYSIKLQKITSSTPLNEACICPPNLYYDASINKCVNGDLCPCYSKNRVYRLGEIITQADGQTCPCERVLQCGEPEQPPVPDVQTCSNDEVYSDCLVGYGKSCEPSCQNLAILDQVCTSKCEPGCVCRTGMLRSSDGNCVLLNECPCVHGEDVYNPGETLAQDCNTCTCENGKFVCSNNPCNRVCNTYAGSQFFLFDGVWKTFATRHCAILLVESVEGVSPSFSVVMQNTPNEEDGGALHRKIITIKFGGTAVLLSDSDPVVINDAGANTEFKTYRSGFYVVVHFLGGLAVYYDQHLDVIIQLEPKLQGKVQGMCGDADGTTTSEVEISNMAQYASRFVIGECPEDENPLPPPSENHKKFVENRCNLLKSSVFADCHYVVNVEPYFSACVEETEACREGESCLCYCTSLAAYARACCRKGVTVEWRGPDTCPSPCEYYNRDAGEGPYRLEMINGASLVADYDNGAVALENIKTPGNLQASFMVTKGLFVDPLNGRRLISLESAQHHNFFIVQNNDGTLSLRKWQPSVEFRSQATFILRPSRWVKNYNALESYISRGNYLSLNNNRLVMSRVKSGSMLQMNFDLVEETFGLPSFSICTWKYRACGNPCIPTCQDPLGTNCTLTLKVEGCYPLCAPGMVFDEVTHRCVQIEDCINLPPVIPSQTPRPHTPPPQTPPPETPPPETPPPQTPPPETPPPKTPPPQTPPPQSPPPQSPPPQTPPPQTPPPQNCKGKVCPPEPDCFMQGSRKVYNQAEDPCCPEVDCVCDPCAPPPDCGPEGLLSKSIDPETQCCFQYNCTGTHSKPTIPTPVPGTTLPSVPGTTPTKPTLPSPPPPCLDVFCPPVSCKKVDAVPVVVEPSSATRCCPVFDCQCQEQCKIPTCSSDSPPVLVGDPELQCCPTLECPPPPTPLPPPCSRITCAPEPTCDENEYKIQSLIPDDPCCKTFLCIPKPTTPPPPPPVTPCETSGCPPADCKVGEKVVEMPNTENACCPSYICIIPPPPTTPLVPSTEPSINCHGITCTVPVCLRNGERSVQVPTSDLCCPAYECQCDPCPAAPYCGDSQPNVSFTMDSECCPIYECPPPTTLPSYTTPPTPPPPPPPCLDVLCLPVSCKKMGAEPVVVEPTSATRCCPVIECKCQNECNIPTCDDNRPPLLLGDPETKCCPEHQCPPPPTPPPPPCRHVTCAPEPTCEENEYKVQSPTEDPCCASFHCIPIPTTPPPPPPVTPCESSGCQPADCKVGEKVVEIPNTENSCCPSYICIPPPPPPTTPSVVSTTPVPVCHGITCTVPVCLRNGEKTVRVPTSDLCCPAYECQCDPCPPAPYCGDMQPIVNFNLETECCPIYECPIPTTPQPPPPETTTPTPPPPPPPPPCLDVLCLPVSCKKMGAEPVVVEPTSATRCCPVIECQCQNECNIPTCDDNRPPLLLGDPETKCCPEHQCPPPPTPPPPICKYVTCAPEPTCEENEYKIQSLTEDPCCASFHCIPIPTTPPPSSTATPCESSGCQPADCKDGERVVEVPNTENSCCPSYICIPPPPPPTTPSVVSTTPVPICHGITCTVPVCLRNGERAVQVPTSDLCCPAYECQCDPCPAAPYCGDMQPILNFNLATECCPIYQCPIPTTPQPPPPETTTPTPPPPPPPPPCLDVLCLPVSCKKMGAEPVVVEPTSATRCCPVIECQCQNECNIPTCDDNRPPLLLGDPETKCCPEHQCPPPPTPPPPICKYVTCAPEPTCEENEYKIQSLTEDPCCASFHCIPIPTTPPPSSTATPCESSGCQPADCKDGERVVEVPNTENSCCPSYICIPPPPPPTTPSVVSTTPVPICHGITCTVPVCLRNGERAVQVPTSDLCCPAYECQCDPCPAAPYCGDMQPILNFNLATECCPIYQCPIPTTPQPPPPETTTPTPPPPPPPPPCLDVLCLPVSCKKMGAEPVVVEPTSATRCCPVIECQCQNECNIPTCDDNRPPLLLGDPETKCCPEHQCPPPPTPPPPICKYVTCAPEPTCEENEYKIQSLTEDPCCASFHCIPIPTTPPPSSTATPCESSGCQPADCKDGERVVEVPNTEDSCCPSYICIPPPPPPTTPSVVSTTPVPICHGITCTVPVCLRNGERAVQVPTSDPCCPAYECQCDPCPAAPYCGDMQPIVNFNLDTECCPIYECPIPTTPQPPPPETTTPTPPPPPPPCLDVLCLPVSCKKMGAVPVVVEPTSATRCCPVIECQCQKKCNIPTCDDNRPPLLLGDPEKECCPEHQCPPPPTPPPPPCRHVTCAPEPTCKENEYKIQSSTDDPCCNAFFCIPIPTTPPPSSTPTETPCESSGCQPADCKDGERVVEVPNTEDSCCPSYICIPPPPPPITPPVIPTTHVPICHGITCTVPVCLRNGERSVQVPTSDRCCPAYECQCDPCPPAPYCGDKQPIVNFNLDTECCPIYECPILTTPQPPPPETITPTQPPPPPPCLDVLCPPVTCKKMGAEPVVMEPPSATHCCPVIECQCQEKCNIPTCDDNRPPLLLGDPETECCPEHQCPPPPTPLPPPCRHVTCAPEPTCKEHEYKIQSPTDDPCCDAFYCIPIPTTSPPPPPITPCESSGCPPADCKDGEKVVEMPNTEDSCCPSYICIPPPPPSPTPPVISTTPIPICHGIICNVPVCLRNGEIAAQVPTSDPCCPAYECQCYPCPPPPYCGDKQPIVNFNLDAECCPIYECPPPTPITPPPPPPPPSTPEHTTPKTTVIISSTTHGCKDRICPVKQCKDFENVVTHFNPKDPCCPQQTCECTCKTIPSCDSDERLVAVRQNNQCCPKLKCERKKDECHPVNTAVNLQSGHCSANVILATCSGYCHSKTEYSKLWAPVSQCRCCSVTSTRPKNFELSCQDGSRAHITVQEALQCGCRHCSEDGGSGDGSGSGSEDDGSGFTLWSNFQETN
ncbi:uncharacterized protein [Aquarana catesbeiana]|uniref:uncharacterized protein isoform X4 n=1 Tax=Aquarana catesbeiana TaxID=8400 RepID=UPI003CCA5036